MSVYVAAFVVFLAVIVGMSVGVIVSNRRIRGSCGGLSAWKDALGRPMCDACADCPSKKRDCELESGEDEPTAGTVPAATRSSES